MKMLPAFFAALATIGSLAVAIPQTITPNGFLRVAGVLFEQFATDPATWDGNADLKGHWETQGNISTLQDSAAVFGISADRITVEQEDGHVRSIRVVFSASPKQGARRTDLLRQVKANVQAFTAEAGSPGSGGAIAYRYKTLTITLRSGAGGDVVVDFTRA